MAVTRSHLTLRDESGQCCNEGRAKRRASLRPRTMSLDDQSKHRGHIAKLADGERNACDQRPMSRSHMRLNTRGVHHRRHQERSDLARTKQE